MVALATETVLSVRHWNDTLFSFTTTRDTALRFRNGQFVMIGLQVNGKPLMRAYSIASPNYEETLEFFSIKVENGPLTKSEEHTSELQSLMRISYAVFCLKKKKTKITKNKNPD